LERKYPRTTANHRSSQYPQFIHHTLVGKAAPLHVEIEEIKTQLGEKVTKAKKAREAEAKASFRSEVQLECHRSSGKAFIKAMTNW
jgi:hypothetical protein